MKFYLKLLLVVSMLFNVKLAIAHDKVKEGFPHVVVSIKPLHAWVSAVMEGVGKPYLLLKNSDSVHSYSLKPSDATELSKSDIVFITDKHMEVYLQRPMANLAFKAKIVELSKAPGVNLLPAREGGLFEAHGSKSGKKSYNFHFWLDPENAIAATKYIADALSSIDKKHADQYHKNAENYIVKLRKEIVDTAIRLKGYKDINFIVFHDAYYYYEKRFGISALGSVTINPEHQPGAKRIELIRNKVKTLKAACIFTEPQFSPAIIKSIIEGTKAKEGTLDPIGADLPEGADSYLKLIDNVTTSLISCGKSK